MIRRLARHACLMIAALLLHNPSPAATPQGDAPAARAARGFMWEATRANERVLLLGAIHVGRPEFQAFDSTDMLRMIEAKVVVFEANIFDARATAEATRRIAMYADGVPGLDQRLPAELVARIEALIERSGGNVPACCRMKPWMLANTLVVLEAVRAGYHPAYGTEALLYQLAQASGKRLAEIESVEAQLRLFDEAAESTQIDYLRHTVETIESGASRAEIEQLVTSWERGDATAMEKLNAEMASGPDLAERFVFERIIKGRHPKMLAAIERFAASGELHLVAIGALHYFGPQGLLQSLRQRGFVLKRLS
jgi:uncharacterized protein YbaP (TraB family)